MIPTRSTFMIRPAILATSTLIVLVATACSGGASSIETPQDPSENHITVILATTVLQVGPQRVAFLLASPKTLIKVPEATVTSMPLGASNQISKTNIATFHLWPYGVRGAYSTELTFDRPGPWRLDITIDNEQGTDKAQLVVEVAKQVSLPAIGSIAPPSESKTIRSESHLRDLSTDSTPDPDLYQLSIAEAVDTGKPTVVVFATPAFCTSPTCGPQVDTISDLKNRHGDKANFIHVELYDNPNEIQGDLSRAVLAETVHEWGLSAIPNWFNESWTFVLDHDGRIKQRFEGFTTIDELDEILLPLIEITTE
jgi:hypothetical protein